MHDYLATRMTCLANVPSTANLTSFAFLSELIGKTSVLAWHRLFQLLFSLPTFLPPALSLLHRNIMGTFDDSEPAYSPLRHPATMRRERREAKRRMVLLSLLASLFFLTWVAFRRSNSFMSDYTHRPTNSTASAAKPNTQGKSWLRGRPKSTGPILGNTGRRLSDTSLADLKNTSLGVRGIQPLADDELSLITFLFIVREGFRPQYAITD